MSRLRALLGQQDRVINESISAANISLELAKNQLLPLLKRISDEFADETQISANNYLFRRMSLKTPDVQFSCAAELQPPSSSTSDGNLAAQITFTLHSNGSIAVTIYPHVSETSKFGRDKEYTVALFESAKELIERGGEKKIQNLFELYLKVVVESDPRKQPSRTSQKLISYLEQRARKFQAPFSSRKSHREAVVSGAVGLGMGLMGGLIASTILPMAQGYGQIAKQKIDNAKCGLPENTAAYFHCMNDSVNWVDRLAAKTLTTGTLLLAALAILVITAWLMKRVLKL
jgi:hypothetical protein